MRPLENVDPRWIPVPVRVIMGVILMVAGYQKLTNLGGTAGFFGQVGIPAPEVMAAFIAGLELIGGLLLIVGLGVRWLALLYVCEFLVAAFVVKLPRMGWDPTRIDFMMLAGALTLLLAGAGAASVDAMLSRRRAAGVAWRPRAIGSPPRSVRSGPVASQANRGSGQKSILARDIPASRSQSRQPA